MQIVPFVLIIAGAVMILAGIKGDNPLSIIKGVLTGA